ncbi:hypothetical protein [Clostridium sp. CCUG 7971]|uniref:hypothetical protein n=1 Tax=Clostridium sp. CCUG 7971 TaxID=2811414 RepID=UPI001ABBB9A7|nr:hypothetical protein [Clostridium sp. CCUG 7971]MBO3444951.1 hypothetical protein [Clostridium sp. CCUG 7971]
MRISSEDIKVKVNYPEDSYWNDEIESIKAKWILDQQLELYGEENLVLAYQIWISIKEIEDTGATYEQAKKIVFKRYIDR